MHLCCYSLIFILLVTLGKDRIIPNISIDYPSTLGLYLGYKVINVHHLITILFIYIKGNFKALSRSFTNIVARNSLICLL